ncbi:Aste57867_19574 [Aphanomyces stellatus]|uniref:Aste57867_19574 protein n=1 Tax=Aphanomyces stellatus TaxID=120398 RepID=A0A485LDK9_9STRA|nr:hypothetical protein As57867_019510 [Aphanomyces stellatus]VFT96277.1 Aste57867_19574 [Aphanomyces stellatus]
MATVDNAANNAAAAPLPMSALYPDKQTESRGGTDAVGSGDPGTHLGRLRWRWVGGPTNSRHCGNHRGDHLDRMMLSQAVARTDLFPEKQTESRGGTDTVRFCKPRTHLGRLRRCWGGGPTKSRHCGNHRGDHLDRMMLSQAVVRTDLFPEKQTESRGGTDTVRSGKPGTHLGRLCQCWARPTAGAAAPTVAAPWTGKSVLPAAAEAPLLTKFSTIGMPAVTLDWTAMSTSALIECVLVFVFPR